MRTVYTNSEGHILALDATQNDTLTPVETEAFDDKTLWPDVRILKYAIIVKEAEEKGDESTAEIFPYKMVDECEAEVQAATELQAALLALGVTPGGTLAQSTAAVREAIDRLCAAIPDQEAKDYAVLYPLWEADTKYSTGQIVQYQDALYKCAQGHTSLVYWTPTGSPTLWTRIDESHAGTKDDPIPAALNMEYKKGLFYFEIDTLYECIRDSGVPLQHLPSQLVGHYFKVVEK